MATKLVVSSLFFAFATAQSSKSTDDTAAYSASLGGMDYVWMVYAVIALSCSLCCIIPCGIFNSWCKATKYDGLSEECYAEIIQARGYDASTTGMGDKRALSLMVLRADLKEKVIWHDDWKLDFVTFIRNEHALFSTCYVHPDHPFSRRDRRCILISVLMMDFAIAMGITVWFASLDVSETVENVSDYALSYIFGAIMTLLESILVTFAVCGAGEKCPTCIRDMCKCCGTMVICTALSWAIGGFITAIVFMIILAQNDNSAEYWQLFALNFIVGLIQAWFLMDLIKMGLQFRTIWKDSHPPEGEEKEEDIKTRKSFKWKCAKCSFFVCCFPVWLLWQCCCNNKKKKDPYDWEQDDFGVTYKEYTAWKTGQDIGKRPLPKSYQSTNMHAYGVKLNNAVQGKVDNVTQGVTNKVDNAKQNVTNTIDANVAGLKKTKNNFANKMKMGINLGKKKKGNDVELVVGDGNNNDPNYQHVQDQSTQIR